MLSLSVGLLASLPNITLKSRPPRAEILHGLAGQIEGAAINTSLVIVGFFGWAILGLIPKQDQQG
ncbi:MULTISPECIES: hypothetical protein [unclassified Bradyrhizobium]|uniref:hypothetical protein n=1 Tax=unclassified Bradyrhizobium TaxID=2631580 RepID=UPI002FEF7DE9